MHQGNHDRINKPGHIVSFAYYSQNEGQENFGHGFDWKLMLCNLRKKVKIK